MVTMAICWEAIFTMIEVIFLVSLFLSSLAMLSSDKKWVKVAGMALIGLYVIVFLVAVYFVLSKTMC